MKLDDAFRKRFEAELAKSDPKADPRLARLGAFARAIDADPEALKTASDAVARAKTGRTRDEISWQVERWAWEGPAAHWAPSALTHYNVSDAIREAEQSLARYGGRWRVVRKSLIRVWP